MLYSNIIKLYACNITIYPQNNFVNINLNPKDIIIVFLNDYEIMFNL